MFINCFLGNYYYCIPLVLEQTTDKEEGTKSQGKFRSESETKQKQQKGGNSCPLNILEKSVLENLSSNMKQQGAAGSG